MNAVIRLLPVTFVLAACDRDRTADAPKAVEVEQAAAAEPAPAPRAVIVAEDPAYPPGSLSGTPPPVGSVVIQPDPAEVVASPARQPRKRVVQVVDRIGQGLETAGEKTREAAAVAEDSTKAAVEVARDKTETGLRKAASATGDFLQRAGEKIEEKAEEP